MFKLSHVSVPCCVCIYAVPAKVQTCHAVCPLTQKARIVEAVLPAELHAPDGPCKPPEPQVLSHCWAAGLRLSRQLTAPNAMALAAPLCPPCCSLYSTSPSPMLQVHQQLSKSLKQARGFLQSLRILCQDAD